MAFLIILYDKNNYRFNSTNKWNDASDISLDFKLQTQQSKYVFHKRFPRSINANEINN